MPASTLIVGCGYLGQRVGRLLAERGEQVFGTTRSPSKADHLRSLGIDPVTADVLEPVSFRGLPPVDRVLYCVGFDRQAGRSIREVYVDGLAVFLDFLADQQFHWPIVYASSTGVYGGNDGGWVDETTPADPQTESGEACLAAEVLLRAEHTAGWTILRFAGLYGPNRIMRQASLLRGEPVVGSPAKYLNLIQIDDAAAVSVRALDEVATGGRELFLVSDGHPVTRTEFYGVTAELLGAPSPRFEPPAPASPAPFRSEANKRVSNRKLLATWGKILRYPDLRAGLTASLAQP